MKKLKLTSITLIALLLFFAIPSCVNNQPTERSDNKKTVKKYMTAFSKKDHSQILSCLTDDIVWELPGAYSHKGKAEFDKEIENEAFIGLPTIIVNRLTEEQNVVIAQGFVTATKKDGVKIKLAFCDVFEMDNGLIKKLTSYLMVVGK